MLLRKTPLLIIWGLTLLDRLLVASRSFSTAGKEHVAMFLIIHLNVLDAHDLGFTVFQKILVAGEICAFLKFNIYIYSTGNILRLV